jgi:hypothetical protein
VHIGDNPPIMANPTPAQLHAYIAAGLGCDHLDVQGDGQHFYATIVSPEFEGLRACTATSGCMPPWASACAPKSTPSR